MSEIKIPPGIPIIGGRDKGMTPCIKMVVRGREFRIDVPSLEKWLPVLCLIETSDPAIERIMGQIGLRLVDVDKKIMWPWQTEEDMYDGPKGPYKRVDVEEGKTDRDGNGGSGDRTH